MSQGGNGSFPVGTVLGAARLLTPSTVGVALTNIGALSVPLPSVPGMISVFADIPWALAGAVSPVYFALCILEDGVILNYSIQNLLALQQEHITCPVIEHQPTPGAHTYSVQAQTSASTVNVFAENVNPIVMPQLWVEAA